MIFEFLFCIGVDRHIVKKYQKSLRNEAMHLKKVKRFLKNVYPGKSLFAADKIDILITRLSDYLKLPSLKSFTGKLNTFAKQIILPVATYIAGVYSSRVAALGFANIVGVAIKIITVLALFYFMWLFVSYTLRKIVFRDYDVALALCEDLKDIKLMFFTDSKTPAQE